MAPGASIQDGKLLWPAHPIKFFVPATAIATLKVRMLSCTCSFAPIMISLQHLDGSAVQPVLQTIYVQVCMDLQQWGTQHRMPHGMASTTSVAVAVAVAVPCYDQPVQAISDHSRLLQAAVEAKQPLYLELARYLAPGTDTLTDPAFEAYHGLAAVPVADQLSEPGRTAATLQGVVTLAYLAGQQAGALPQPGLPSPDPPANAKVTPLGPPICLHLCSGAAPV